MDNQVTLPGKDVLPITSILGRLPVVSAGDTGTIPFGNRSGCRNCAHSYNHYLTSADSSRGAGDSCLMYMYLVNSLGLGWSSDPCVASDHTIVFFLSTIFTLFSTPPQP